MTASTPSGALESQRLIDKAAKVNVLIDAKGGHSRRVGRATAEALYELGFLHDPGSPSGDLAAMRKALEAIAEMPNEDDEWHGRDQFLDARKIAREALSSPPVPGG